MEKHPPFNITPLAGENKYTRLLKPGESSLLLKSGFVVLKSAESVGEHSTAKREEIVIFLEGRARVFIEGQEPVDVQKPAAIYVPPHTKHDIKNTGSGLLKYVFTVAPVEYSGEN